MNLADMLCYADIHELSRIAKTYDCSCSTHSKNELIQSILAEIGRKDRFEREIGELSVGDVRFLNYLLFDNRNAFSLEELLARANQAKFDGATEANRNPRDVIASFKQRGWLFQGFSQQTRYLYRMPNDLKQRFGDALAAKFRESLIATDESPTVYRDEYGLMGDDILRFLRFVKDHEPALSADGYLYKRTLQQLIGGLAVHEQPLAKTPFRFGYGRRFKEYPNRFSYLYDYCFFHQLIEEQGHTLMLTVQGSERLAENRREDALQLYRFWLRLYKSAVPNLQSIAHWTERLSRDWVTFDSLQRLLVRLIRPFYYDAPESIFEQRIVQMMMHLGLVRLGESEGLGAVVQVSRFGRTVILGTYVAEEDKIDLKLDAH